MKISPLLLICVPLISGSNTNAAAPPNGEPMTTPTDTSIQLASDQTIGRIEPVFEFYDAMPTGVTVSAGGRIFINFPRCGWHGGWVWKRVARSLREEGHDVYTPTMTGLGERSHLLNATIDVLNHAPQTRQARVKQNIQEI